MGDDMMAYRGEDLDLRTPQTWVAAPAALSASSELPVQQSGNRGGYRSGPILVDETVLACCNYATMSPWLIALPMSASNIF
jgi:hypothetical protein